MTQNPVQTEALSTYLQDLHRAGVTACLNEEPFPLYGAKPYKKHISQNANATTKANKTKEQQNVNTENTTSTPRQTPSKEGHIWHLGKEISSADICVICFHKRIDSKTAFSGDVNTLFTKMMQAIHINTDNIHYILHSGMDEQKQLLLKEISKEKPLLIVGQDSCQTLLGTTINKADITPKLEDIYCVGTVPHPQLLMRQPILKRLAWKHLLAFKMKMGGDA